MNTDFSDTVQAKSDQMNAIDFIAGPATYKVISAHKTTDPKQPIAIMVEGHAQPYKPSLGYRRILTAVWGMDGKAWAGRYLTLDLDESVVYAGKEVGGICVKAMSNLDTPKRFKLATSRGKFKFVTVDTIQIAFYDEQSFQERLPKALAAIESGKMTVEAAIDLFESTAPLTDAQKLQITGATE